MKYMLIEVVERKIADPEYFDTHDTPMMRCVDVLPRSALSR